MFDVSYWLSTVTSYNMAELTTSNVAIDLTWSISGSTAITYSLVAYSTYTLPTWVTLDTTNSQLVMTTPDVTATTNYGLIVRSTISSTNYDKIVLISVVNNPTTTTPTTTTPASTTTPTTTSASASSASSSSSDHLPLTSSQARATTSSVISVSILMGITVSIVSVYSPQKMWAILNQFQLYLLIGVLVPSLPQNLLELILSMQDSLVSFNILSKPSIKDIGFRFSMPNCKASGDYFCNIGIPSSCSLVDNLQLFSTYFVFLWSHLLVLLLLALSVKCKWLRKKIVDKAIQDDDVLSIPEASSSKLHGATADEFQRAQACRTQQTRSFNFVRSFSGCSLDLTADDAGFMTLHPCDVEAWLQNRDFVFQRVSRRP